MKKRFFWVLLPLLFPFIAQSQITLHKRIEWLSNKIEQRSEFDKMVFPSFKDATYNEDFLPTSVEIIDLPNGVNQVQVELIDDRYESTEKLEWMEVKNASKIATSVAISAEVAYEQKSPKAVISLLPLRLNPQTGKIERLLSYSLKVTPQSNGSGLKTSSLSYAANSVLAQGDWFKIGITKDGIYKISYHYLKLLGIPVDSINPKQLQLYGNGGKMLAYLNSAPHYDDLQENAIEVIGEADNKMDSSDYILFYGQGTTRWNYTPVDQKFHHQLHLFSDTNYYFIKIGNTAGKRIQSQVSEAGPSNFTVTSFDDYDFHEIESVNFIQTGKNWYGENFGIVNNYSFNFSFPNIDFSSNVYLKADVMAKSSPASKFTVNCQSGSILLQPAAEIPTCYYCDYALPANGTTTFIPNSANLNVNVNFIKSPSAISASGWLNYLEMNARRLMIMTGNQMAFRDVSSVGPNNISDFVLNNANSGIHIWDITDILDVKKQLTNVNLGALTFRLSTPILREFIAFNDAGYLTPTPFGRIENQNLHEIKTVDLIVVTHPLFMAEANQIADFHESFDSLRTLVVTPQQIYNEFSSGMQDITAIKHFVKMFYDRAVTAADMPKYLLLFGDGSYDNRNRNITSNTNFIPTYQSENSTDQTKSYVSDDFYGLLDDNESDGLAQLMDIGVGRFPAKTKAEAQAMVNKVIRYETMISSSAGDIAAKENADWKNIVCFVADDEDGNTHLTDAETISTYVDTNYRNVNIDKIYFDAYKQISTAGGERYPDVTSAINQRVEGGALILNYTGHGGETGWAHERVLDVSTINSWNNTNKLPLFVTATCEFSRFDDPGRTSAGEDVLLNPNGGGIGLLTTTRLVYSNPNFVLNFNFYKNVFKPINGKMPRVGDVTKVTKNLSVSAASSNHRNFTLLGDPAMRLAYPHQTVKASTLNNQTISVLADTMKSLSKITITGFLQDAAGNKLTNFNGLIYPTVFDKSRAITTQNNNTGSPRKTFYLQKSIVYKGKVSVKAGEYSFTFIVPKDIAYNFGLGRLSFYAENGETDASGYNEDFIIGGNATNIDADNEGPTVNLFMNNEKFISGGITNENPVLLAKVEDKNGINTVGNGIGHDIVSVLDESNDGSIVLNDYYQSDLDSYQKGTIRYQLSNLSEGNHNISLKVWDVYNNSATARTEFVVAASAKLALERVFNYPNPFTTSTNFYFQHNQADNGMNVQIQIFTVSGKLIKTIEQYVRTEGFSSESIHWDGLDDFGDKIGKGVYIYRLKAIDSTGGKADKFEKLVILN